MEKMHIIYSYLEIIGYPTNFTSSVRHYHHFSTTFSTNNDTKTIQKVIHALRIIQTVIWECFGWTVHKADYYIICGPNSPPSSIIIKMNQFNALKDDETTGSSKELNIQTSPV